MENLTRQNAVEDHYFARNIDNCIAYLIKKRQEGKSVWVEFNGKRLYSCDATENGIYLQMYGRTKEEYGREEEDVLSEENNLKQKRRANMPDWLKQGENLVYPEKAREWERVVTARVNDMHSSGNDLQYAITAMQMLESGSSFEDVNKYMDSLNSLGGNRTMLENIILSFSKKGPDFYEYMRKGDIDRNTSNMIGTIRSQNKEYENNEILTKRVPEWKKRATSLVYPEKLDEWEKVTTPGSANSAKSEEVELALGAMELLNQGKDFEEVKKYIETNSSSEEEIESVAKIVLGFSQTGPEYYETVRPGESTELVEQLKKINSSLAKKHEKSEPAVVRKQDSKPNPRREELSILAAEKKKLESELEIINAQLDEVKEQEEKDATAKE